jgi:hypothetical protein
MYEISAEIVVWESRCALRTDRLQMDVTKLSVAFFFFFERAYVYIH